MSLVPGFPDRVHYINHEQCEAAFVEWKDTSKTGSVCYYAVNYQT